MARAARPSAYAAAGVSIDVKERALQRVKKLARSTLTPGVLSEIGLFGGLYRPDLRGRREPVLVASADGVGTKLAVARLAGDFSTVGRDLVNHCVNDILAQGAEPLFFLDYVGAGALDPGKLVELVRGVVRGCRENGCALLGGETAEMPGFYRAGDYELVGFIVGIVERRRLLDGTRVRAGDLLLGLPSAGLHTNGYSLARRILLDELGLRLGDRIPGARTRATVGRLLLAPHRSYLRALRPLLGDPGLHAMAHVTGGGLTDNLPRVLPRGAHAEIRLGSWPVPELFRLLERHGRVERDEMLRVFNMGVGMVLIVGASAAERIGARLRRAKQRFFTIGRVRAGGRGVDYVAG
jgi:phosphoribosylformylglycinamidine cyclo-ligase